jgi:hypothetical protein
MDKFGEAIEAQIQLLMQYNITEEPSYVIIGECPAV